MDVLYRAIQIDELLLFYEAEDEIKKLSKFDILVLNAEQILKTDSDNMVP